jgi:hypothetical protein
MKFKRRPRFSAAQRLQLDLLIASELEYIDENPSVCMFDTEQEANDLLVVIKANSKKATTE